MAKLTKNLERIVATMPGVRSEVRATADKTMAIAESLFAPHNNPGGHELARSNGKVDAFVDLVGPAPEIVEYGRSAYWMSVTVRNADGSRTRRRFIVGAAEGLHVLTRAKDQT